MPSPAVLVPNASPEWAALRLFAAGVRDNADLADAARADGKSLCQVLDACQDLQHRPQLSLELWASALKLAEKMGYAHRNGDWREPPAKRRK